MNFKRSITVPKGKSSVIVMLPIDLTREHKWEEEEALFFHKIKLKKSYGIVITKEKIKEFEDED